MGIFVVSTGISGSILGGVILGFLALGWGSGEGFAQGIQWSVNEAVLEGDGCAAGVDSFVIANGNDLSIIFSNLGLSLTGTESPLRAAKSCVARVPARIDPGQFIADLTQVMGYGITKSENSELTLRNRAVFFGVELSSPEITEGRGRRVNNPYLQQRRKERFERRRGGSWFESWCDRRRPLSGAFRTRIAVRGQRDSVNEDLIAFVDGVDFRYEIQSVLASCDTLVR